MMAPKRREKEVNEEVNEEITDDETGALLMLPSPGSTNRPSMSNVGYGSVPGGNQHSSNGSLIQMHEAHNNNSFGDDDMDIYSHRKRRHFFLWGVSGLALVAVLAVLASHNHPASTHHIGRSKQHGEHDSTSSSSNSIHEQHGFISRAARVLSGKHPVKDLQIPLFKRPDFSAPNPTLFQVDSDTNSSSSQEKAALPTNAWYQNLLLAPHHSDPTEEQRVYPVPYVVDVVGPIPGLRVHHPTVVAGATVIQLSQVLEHGLTLGAATRSSLIGTSTTQEEAVSKKYNITKMTALGITLEWNDPSDERPLVPLSYSTSIVRGMPYATMQYNSNQQQQLPNNVNDDSSTMEIPSRIEKSLHRGSSHKHPKNDKALHQQEKDNIILPTLASEIHLRAPPRLDGATELVCHDASAPSSSKYSKPQLVHREIELVFAESDYTWLVFLSRPVYVQCILPPAKAPQVFVPGVAPKSNGVVFALQMLDNYIVDSDAADKSDLVLRVALANDCTTGSNPSTCGRAGSQQHNLPANQTAFASLLRLNADLYPGPDTDVSFDFLRQNNNETTTMTATRMKFNWNVQSMAHGEIYDNNIDNTPHSIEDGWEGGTESQLSVGKAKLLMYALPHHQDMIEASTTMPAAMSLGGSSSSSEQQENQESSFPTHTVIEATDDKNCDTTISEARFCTSSLLGPSCLVQGSTWSLREEHKWTSFRAPRPPQNSSLSALAKAYNDDLNYTLPSYYQRGAGDTYFSGKMLAKLARILTIGEELHEICTEDNPDRPDQCRGLGIPSLDDKEFQHAVARLRSGVEVWINGTADTPFVYDDTWGGLVSCGCNFDEDKGACRNQYPDCPAFYDPGMNFGNAYYNDHHFHYGYHINAAAAVAHFDPKWGRDHFEHVLLIIRDIANPSRDDSSFPTFRHKDWYQGSSWASGIAVSPLNGRNQESSSEAIAGYEAIALYGKEMVHAWKGHDHSNEAVAQEIQHYGELLTASELRSADRYWHVIEANMRRQYPVEYKPHVVGIMWNNMAQFQTWFGAAAYLAYGIQLLPLTSVAEERDTAEWVRELYQPFAESCEAQIGNCRDGGWSILVLAALATVGHREKAIGKALEIPVGAFTSAGGNGHSLTNTLWYLATRPDVIDPLIIDPAKEKNHKPTTGEFEKDMHRQSDTNDISGQPSGPVLVPASSSDDQFSCNCPKTCDEHALNRYAVGHTCRDRIAWLITLRKDGNEWDACHQVGVEFPEHCAACDPLVCSAKNESHSKTCLPCSKKVCQGRLNLCPVQNAPFLCTDGPSKGGCSRSPWTVEHGMWCESCCELSLGCEDE